MNISQLICLTRKRPRAASPNPTRRLSPHSVTREAGSSVKPAVRLQNRQFLTHSSPIDRRANLRPVDAAMKLVRHEHDTALTKGQIHEFINS
jgi:hypothetical protein